MSLVFNEDDHSYFVDGKRVPSVTEVCSLLTADKYSGGQALIHAAAVRGTAVHELCALYDMDALPDEIDPAYSCYLKAWAAFCRDYRPQWLWIEKPLGSQRLAGTVDRIGIIDGHPVIVDIKTTSSMDRVSKISLACQLAGYEILAELLRINVEKDSGLGVQLRRDGTYTVHSASKIAEKYAFLPHSFFYSMLDIIRTTKGY